MKFLSRLTDISNIKRIKFREELESILSDFKKCGMKTNFIHIAGALPQEKGIDNWKKLVQI